MQNVTMICKLQESTQAVPLLVGRGLSPWGVDAGWEAVVWGLVLLGGVVTNSGAASINPQLLPSHIPVVLHCFVLIHFFILVLGNVTGFILMRWSYDSCVLDKDPLGQKRSEDML